jgi:hypothetical protein
LQPFLARTTANANLLIGNIWFNLNDDFEGIFNSKVTASLHRNVHDQGDVLTTQQRRNNNGFATVLKPRSLAQTLDLHPSARQGAIAP